jgi:hypothetical protein
MRMLRGTAAQHCHVPVSICICFHNAKLVNTSWPATTTHTHTHPDAGAAGAVGTYGFTSKMAADTRLLTSASTSLTRATRCPLGHCSR